MGVKGSKNFQNAYGYNNGADIQNEYLVYRNPNPTFQMPLHQSLQTINSTSPIQSSSRLEAKNFETEIEKCNTVRRKPVSSSYESHHKSGNKTTF